MTALEGIFALGVCMLVPGFLLLEALRVRLSPLAAGVAAIGLSFTLNHYLVVILVLLGGYRQNVVLALAVCELVALSVLLRIRVWQAATVGASIVPTLSISPVLLAPSLAIFAYVFWVLGKKAFLDFGEVFTSWDAVVSWNKWATEWASGSFPIQTFEYPQMLPTLWSLAYVILGQELQVFPKAMMAWLPTLMMAVFADIALRGQIVTGCVAAITSLALLLPFASLSMSGYADFPTGFLSLLAFYLLQLSRKQAASNLLWVLGALVAAGAALTKQAGVFFALVYPLSLWLMAPRRRMRALQSGLILVLLVTPWYVYRWYAIKFGGELSNIAQTTQLIHAGRNYFERMEYGVGLIVGSVDGPLLTCALGLLVAALWSRAGRVLVLTVVVPYLIIYGFFFSYDIRNAVPAIPFVGWGMGIGASNLARLVRLRMGEFGRDLFRRPTTLLHWFKAPVAGALAILFIFMVALSIYSQMGRWPTARTLAADQNRRLMLLGDPTINRAVVEFIETEHPTGKLLTNNYLLAAIPVVKPYYLAFLMGPWTTPETLQYIIKSQSVSAILAIDGAAAHLRPNIDQWISEGRMVLRAGTPETWILLQVRSSSG